jgi:CubicO group peptidase (beta-lactamase class C family)
VSELKPEADPAELGLDPDRLDRIGRHFARYVDDGSLPGWLITLSRYGRLAYVSACGSRDAEAGLPAETDTVWRIYSMTKPITSVAAMMLYEEGGFELTDPVSSFIPSFAGVRVYAGGSDLQQVTVPAAEPVRIWHLLTHTAGLTYGPGTPGRRHVPGRRARAWPRRATSGRGSRCSSSPAPSGTTRWRPTCSAG